MGCQVSVLVSKRKGNHSPKLNQSANVRNQNTKCHMTKNLLQCPYMHTWMMIQNHYCLLLSQSQVDDLLCQMLMTVPEISKRKSECCCCHHHSRRLLWRFLYINREKGYYMHLIFMSKQAPCLCCVSLIPHVHIKACLNVFTDHSPCNWKSLPLLPQREKSQTFSFGRVQEITVYISSCITCVSKLSGFGGSGGDRALQT